MGTRIGAAVEQLTGSERMEKPFDLVIKNARVVRPNRHSVDRLDLAFKDGKIARLAPDIPADDFQSSVRRENPPGVSRLR